MTGDSTRAPRGRLSLERKIQLGFAGSLTILLAVGAAALGGTAATADSAASVARVLTVRAAVEHAGAVLAEAGHESDDSIAARLSAVVARLNAIAADNRELRSGMDSLRGLIVLRARARAAAGDAGTPESALAMDRARRLIARMEDEGDQLVLRRVATLDARAQFARLSVFGGTALAFGFAIVASALLRRELSERRRAEERVQESEQRLAQLMDALPIGVFVLDAGGRSNYANQMAQQILGKGIVAGAAGADLPEIYQAYVPGGDEPYPADRQPIMQALSGRKPQSEVMEIRRPDRTVPIEVLAAPVFDRQGRVVSAVAAFSDITERERARAEIERLNVELSRRVADLLAVNHELEAFSYSVSHDLRAPLRSIDGFSQALLEDCDARLDDTGKQHLRRVRAAAQRLGDLIEDLLGLARVTRAELRREPVDLSGMARSVARELCERESGRAVDFSCQDGLRVNADPRLLRVLLENLLGNAWKFTVRAAHPKVELGRTTSGNQATYFVRDNGAGFDMAYAGRLFGTFQRLHDAAEYPGTGIGLATVQRIVHRHGGHVWAEGAVGRGAIFSFTLELQ